MAESDFEIVTTASGALSIRNRVLNETMHNPVGPWEEANGLYVEPSRLTERLVAADHISEDLVVYDIGLGAAANAVAAIHSALRQPAGVPMRRLQIVSFEIDLSLLRFAVRNVEYFRHFVGLESALGRILEDRHWQSPCGRVRWTLHEGHVLDLLDREPRRPQVIFHDPYSPTMNPAMWNAACFRQIFSKCRADDEGSCLYTYSLATPVRAALLAAGFFVGQGPRTGLKRETTQAATRLDLLAQPLGQRWLKRWIRSHTKYPADIKPLQYGPFTSAVVSHPQFA
jgi:queuine tRNA-ribosyltransferase